MTNKNNRRAALICSAPVIIDFLISQQVFFQLLHGTEYMLRADLNELFACAEAPVDRRTLHTGIARGLEVDLGITDIYRVPALDTDVTERRKHGVRIRLAAHLGALFSASGFTAVSCLLEMTASFTPLSRSFCISGTMPSYGPVRMSQWAS